MFQWAIVPGDSAIYAGGDCSWHSPNFMKLLSRIIFLVFALQISLGASAQTSERPVDLVSHPFAKHYRAANHLYVADPSQFHSETGTAIRQGDENRDVGRSRIGRISLAPSIHVIVERATALTHGASFIELYDMKSNKLVGSFDLGLISPEDGGCPGFCVNGG